MTTEKHLMGTEWHDAVVALSKGGKQTILGSGQPMQFRFKPQQGGTMLLEMSGSPKWMRCPAGVTHVFLMTTLGEVIHKAKLPKKTKFGDTLSFEGRPVWDGW
jgi:hypothetical protein